MQKSKVYVASSWRNPFQETIVELLRSLGHYVYDFKNPIGSHGFSWSEVDPHWQQWTAKQFIDSFDHPAAVRGLKNDFSELHRCDVCLLLLPSGRSAHLEAGYCIGAEKKVFAFIPESDMIEPELMYGMMDEVIIDTKRLNEVFKITDQ